MKTDHRLPRPIGALESMNRLLSTRQRTLFVIPSIEKADNKYRNIKNSPSLVIHNQKDTLSAFPSLTYSALPDQRFRYKQ